MTTHHVAPFDIRTSTQRTPKRRPVESEDFPPLRQEPEKPEPPLRTEAQIVDAFVRALQTIDIAKIRVGDIRLKTQKSLAGEILTACISGEVNLIFRGEE